MSHNLSNNDIARYSRQIIMSRVQVEGQCSLRDSSVLIVGAGGLGCPAALYLVGAGIGHIGIVDYDVVEVNNLHRQLLHTEADIGKSKVQSAANALKRLNSAVKVSQYNVQLDSQNACDIVKQYDIVLDATDNVATRYLLNDACVLSKKPLVSGSALQWDGQITVYNYKGGPCYRCVFPKPPPPETVTNCGDGGVLGVVPGIIGTIQALETIKIILDQPGVLTRRWLMFDGTDCSFRNVLLREKNPECDVCGSNPTIKCLIDYEAFCGSQACDKDSGISLLDDWERISAQEYQRIVDRKEPHVLIDVRKCVEYEICHIPGSLNIPLVDLNKENELGKLKNEIDKRRSDEINFSVFTLCRRGNDSQRAAVKLKEALQDAHVVIKDIAGGLHAWAKEVDTSFPVY